MSLVERTARRLEELRRSGKGIGGDLVYAHEGQSTTPSTIERVAHELAKRPETKSLPPLEPVLLDANSGVEEVSYDRQGREPTFGRDVSNQVAGANAKLRSRSHKVDIARLAVHGLLTPD